MQNRRALASSEVYIELTGHEVLTLRELCWELDGRIQATINKDTIGEWLRTKDQKTVIEKILAELNGGVQ